ncbi:MAG TPA: hypothetical protein ENH55_16640 [Aurantimonas coralicida]|uniref:Uncharacterized protein n=2 Tax=root TaxID=1 RepID=A0A9C9NEN5_9HYPH|nr:hypothetical protein [Aurantimonas coralicida]HEU00533.1 hypothetical protein [Aurantimonas coralicida]
MGTALFLAGFVVLLVGAISVIKPLTIFRIRSRKDGAVVALAGLLMVNFGAFLHAASSPETDVAAVDDAALVSTGAAEEAQRVKEAARVTEAERVEQARRVEAAKRAKEAARLKEAERLKEAARLAEAERLEEAKPVREARGVKEAKHIENLEMEAEEAAKKAKQERAAALPQGIDLTPGVKRTLAGVIDSGGYNCPSVTVAYPDRETNRGRAIRVFCGPLGKDLLLWEYRVTRRPNGLYLVNPCGFWSCKPAN